MSTAHRPTWKPAMGRAEHGRWTQVTSHDQGYTVMKKRSRKYDDRGREIGEEGKKLEVGAIANTTTATTDCMHLNHTLSWVLHDSSSLSFFPVPHHSCGMMH
eukprot:TRINITY_DN1562_c0_g1_i4.p1 TRINITY_DN1562_c0_g1~~TRINITY_DN1562_c0_g1_i4.p1  ORF type:complete len:102 (-),score=17.63 TRINITY_DN1562_c0_g1_i4:45-350(-)